MLVKVSVQEFVKWTTFRSFGKPVFSLEMPLGKTQVLRCRDGQERSAHTGRDSWGGRVAQVRVLPGDCVCFLAAASPSPQPSCAVNACTRACRKQLHELRCEGGGLREERQWD